MHNSFKIGGVWNAEKSPSFWLFLDDLGWNGWKEQIIAWNFPLHWKVSLVKISWVYSLHYLYIVKDIRTSKIFSTVPKPMQSYNPRYKFLGIKSPELCAEKIQNTFAIFFWLFNESYFTVCHTSLSEYLSSHVVYFFLLLNLTQLFLISCFI